MDDQNDTTGCLDILCGHEPSERSPELEGDVARAIARMLLEGSAAIDLPLESFRHAESQFVSHLLRLHEDPRLSSADQWSRDRAAELKGLIGGRAVIFSAVGEVKAQGDAATLTVTLLHQPTEETAEEPDRARGGLQKWRLKRVIEFIEERIAEPITLSDMAAVAGLSPTYFGAQFRTATGLRPHEYVMRKRIQRAQQLLLETDDPVIEVALSVGFQSQAHFTKVFGRFSDDTPSQWRRRHAIGAGVTGARAERRHKAFMEQGRELARYDVAMQHGESHVPAETE